MPWRSGDAVPPGALGILVQKAGLTSRASTIVVTDDPHLTITLGPGIWQLEVHLSTDGNGGDFKCAWNATGAVLVSRLARGPGPTTANPTDGTMRSSVHGAFANEVTYGTTAGGTGTSYANEVLLFTVATTATLTLQWAQGTSSANATVLGTQSYLLAKLVSP